MFRPRVGQAADRGGVSSPRALTTASVGGSWGVLVIGTPVGEGLMAADEGNRAPPERGSAGDKGDACVTAGRGPRRRARAARNEASVTQEAVRIPQNETRTPHGAMKDPGTCAAGVPHEVSPTGSASHGEPCDPGVGGHSSVDLHCDVSRRCVEGELPVTAAPVDPARTSVVDTVVADLHPESGRTGDRPVHLDRAHLAAARPDRRPCARRGRAATPSPDRRPPRRPGPTCPRAADWWGTRCGRARGRRGGRRSRRADGRSSHGHATRRRPRCDAVPPPGRGRRRRTAARWPRP